ncbi:hypothetical protein AAFN60_14195 [Roseibacillus persicicus]|uniref:hypothetical protein n=1 Tax=Roseibacillus persicicus TaxID=454148 RepID=UPI00398AC591
MKPFLNCVLVATLGLAPLSGYEVWIGTHLATSEMANTPEDWDLMAGQIEGFNVNRAPHDTDPASNNEYRSIFASFPNARNTMTEFARSTASRNPVNVDELAFPSIRERLEDIFSFENSFNYDLSILMFYDERGTYQGTEYLYEWTETEVQYLRDWLDDNGHSDVELMWNVRNNGARAQQFAANPVVDLVEIEASSTALLNNTNNQITFFNWFWTNPATANKRIALQIPRALPGDPLNQYEGTRRVAQMLGGEIGYGEDGMRSDRLIFLPVTYNDNYSYIPETVSNGAAYTNTLTSIALSLIEQRPLFEGRLASLPTVADADSTVRTAPPTVEAIADQVTTVGTTIPSLAVTVADTDTAVMALTVTAISSNETVIPNSGLVLGGSGANRTLSIVPAANQSGNAEITVRVSDGMWFSETSFSVTIGGVLLSDGADANVKDDGGVLSRTENTNQLGAGGNSPFVDRCCIYVFQLPDLGPDTSPFESASFLFNYESKDGTLKNNDLYGLGRRPLPTVLGSDYYGQTTTSDGTDATRLQTGILTNGTPLGAVATSGEGEAALLDYLNTQYASGAGIGEYVFLRLNTSQAKDGINRAILTMSEGGSLAGGQDTRPRIVYTVASGAGIEGLTDVSQSGSEPLVIPFTVNNLGTAFSLSAASSNPDLMGQSGLVFGGTGVNRTLTMTPSSGLDGQTRITVQAGNGSEMVEASFTLTIFGSLLGSESDADVLSSSVTNVGWVRLSGGTTSDNERCMVFPFQLPELGAVTNPFYTASFTINHEVTQNSPVGNLAVYGLGSRAASTVLASDFWSATPEVDTTDATLLQMDMIPAGGSAVGLRSTDASGDSNLSAYLNEQYAGGAGAGKYVFLRLSTDAAQTGSSSRYLVTSVDGAIAEGDESIRPQISYLTTANVFIPDITLIDLGGPVEGTDASSWSDSLPAHAGANYVVPGSGNLRGETGSSIFPGYSITVEAGGRFQIRAKDLDGEVTTVERLILNGGNSYSAGGFAEVTAGTGSDLANVLDGTLMNSGYTRLTTFGNAGGNAISRSLTVQSLVSGTGRIQVRENTGSGLTTATMTNAGNTFAGDWEVESGSHLLFASAGAVGAGAIEVKAGGKVEIVGDWTSTENLTVSDASGTAVVVGSNDWTVAELFLGEESLPAGVYTVAELNVLSANAVFSGNGSITVTDGPTTALGLWRLFYFGSTANMGVGADEFDANGDGESNLLEFATGQNPNGNTLAVFELTGDLPILDFSYPRSVEAVEDGMVFVVEWSDTLLPGSWSTAGVADVLNSMYPGTSEVENRLASVPAGSDRRFVRLRVELP